MLRVKTTVKHSEVDGYGLFAAEFIPEGATTWERDPEFDVAYHQKDLDKQPDFIKELISKYSYFDSDSGLFILCADNQRYINHSENPNIKSTPHKDVAMRDIQAGEELTCNYTDYEPNWFERMGIDRKTFH